MLQKLGSKIVPLLVIGVFVGGLLMMFTKGSNGSKRQTVQVRVPNLSKIAQQGQTLFKGKCMQCHGQNASGTDQGPPLVHKIYEPNHHADGAFFQAARRGVRSHHWPFGNMPPVEGITNKEVSKIVRYVRELQKENGIF